MTINDPELYKKLRNGVFDTMYRLVDVTAAATPDILLQPQHFWNSSFHVITFSSARSTNQVENKISLFPDTKYASTAVQFRDGENPLSGVPANYYAYWLHYTYPARPTVANIEHILQWKEAVEITIHDLEDVTITLLRRINELKQLTKLRRLTLCIQDHSYEQVDVQTLIRNMWFLEEIAFVSYHMTKEQVEDFHRRNDVSDKWKSWISGRIIFFKKKEIGLSGR